MVFTLAAFGQWNARSTSTFCFYDVPRAVDPAVRNAFASVCVVTASATSLVTSFTLFNTDSDWQCTVNHSCRLSLS